MTSTEHRPTVMTSVAAAYVARPTAVVATVPVTGPPSSSTCSAAAAAAAASTSSAPSHLVTSGGVGGGGKDSRWLTLEVCREHVRRRCTRSDDECRFAHPPPHVEVQNGRVVCCFDSIKVEAVLCSAYCRVCVDKHKAPTVVKLDGYSHLHIRTLTTAALGYDSLTLTLKL